MALQAPNEVAPVRLVVNKRKIPKTVGGRYKLTDRIGSGSFGDIYKGVIPGTKEEYAVKLEPTNSQMPQLMYECKLYKHFAGGAGVPIVRWFGAEGPFNIMVMDLLGSSLEDLMTKKKGTICSLKTGIMLADQLISRLEYLHSKDYLHRDIKPDNFLMGREKRKSVVFVIDLGLSKRYRDTKTHIHIPYNMNVGMTGTVRYASTNSHLGNEQSRRDDLEAMGYVFIYLLTGSLPWQGLKIPDREEKFKAITNMKCNMPLKEMCKGCPREFELYFKYVKALKFEEKPDYYYLRRLFRTLFIRNGYTLDFVYDWTLARMQAQAQATGATTATGAESTAALPAADTSASSGTTAASPSAPSSSASSSPTRTDPSSAAAAAAATGSPANSPASNKGEGSPIAKGSPASSKSAAGSPQSSRGSGKEGEEEESEEGGGENEEGEGDEEEEDGEGGGNGDGQNQPQGRDPSSLPTPAQPLSAPARPGVARAPASAPARGVPVKGGVAAAPARGAPAKAKAGVAKVQAKVQAKAKAGAVAGKKK